MITTKLDLGLAIAACVRGQECKRKSDSNELMIYDDGHILLKREIGKDCRLENSGLWLDPTAKDWYIIGNDQTWLEECKKGD